MLGLHLLTNFLLDDDTVVGVNFPGKSGKVIWVHSFWGRGHCCVEVDRIRQSKQAAVLWKRPLTGFMQVFDFMRTTH